MNYSKYLGPCCWFSSRALTLLLLLLLTMGVLCASATANEYQKLLASNGTTGDQFGYSVSISGHWAVVGAPYRVDPLTNSGGAYFFYYDDISKTWIEMQYFSGASNGDRYGNSVSIDGDVAVVGAHGDDDKGIDAGAAYVFRNGGGSWVLENKLLASNGASPDNFGWSVAVSGDVIVVGALRDTVASVVTGSAYVFRYDPVSGWLEEAQLFGSDSAQGDLFGYSVSVFGDVALVGADQDDDLGDNSGSAYLFRYDSLGGWNEEQKLLPSDGGDQHHFGGSVSLNSDVASIGAMGDKHAGPEAGSAYIFRSNAPGNWIEEAKLLPPSTVVGGRFGCSVSIGEDIAVVGAEYAHFTGAAYVFRLTGSSSWSREAELLASDGQQWDYFGHSVSISGQFAIIGAYGDDDNGSESGSLYVFDVISEWFVDDGNISGPWSGSQPHPFQYIQNGIDAASDDDTVHVMPGTYVENINFSGKAITVESDDGPHSTIIDGAEIGSVVTFNSGEGQNSIIRGFTIRNGSAPSGGGVFCASSSPIIDSNIIKENKTTVQAAGHGGGGFYCFDSSVLIVDNIIENNTTVYQGAGINCQGSNSSARIVNNIIRNNISDGDGGGICSYYGALPTISNNMIHDNEARGDYWPGDGGGIDLWESDAMILDNTIVANYALKLGGGVCSRGGSSPTIINTIIWINSPDQISGTPTVTYSDIDGGWSGQGNIDADPVFGDLNSRDLHLTWPSPCCESGDNSAVTELYDFEGDPRISDSTVDMGADEFHRHLYHVGSVIPGSTIAVKAVGTPNTSPVTLGLGSGIQDPPLSTPYGDLWLQLPILKQLPMPDVGTNGLSILNGKIPGSWQSGEQYPIQVLVGNELTNLMVLIVE